MVLLLTAFRMAWPAFAYSIRDERRGAAHLRVRADLPHVVTAWVALALTLLSPWIVDLLAAPRFADSAQVVGPLAFATVSYGAYIVIAIGVGRARRTQFNWVVTGAAAAVNVALNFALIPTYGMMGAAIATVAAYTTMAVGMAWWSQRIYPVPYQWRRVATAAVAGVALAAIGKALDVGLGAAVALRSPTPLRSRRSASRAPRSAGASAASSRASGSRPVDDARVAPRERRPPRAQPDRGRTAASAAGGTRSDR